MAFALNLFNINIHNTYYQSQIGNDFSLIPDDATQQWMNHYRMRLDTTGGDQFALYWLVARLEEPLKTLQSKIEDTKLRFFLTLQNPHTPSFSTLDLDSQYIYHFYNRANASSIHQEEYVSPQDKILTPSPYTSCQKVYKPFFGLVEIYLPTLWESIQLQEKKLPVNYTINIRARETIWRYCVIQKKSFIKNEIKVVFDENDDYFEEDKMEMSRGRSQKVYRSKFPLALKEKPERYFSLKSYKSNMLGLQSWVDTIVEELPVPSHSSLKREGETYYNDILVHI